MHSIKNTCKKWCHLILEHLLCPLGLLHTTNLSMKQGSLFVLFCFVGSYGMLQIMFLVSFESSRWGGVHGQLSSMQMKYQMTLHATSIEFKLNWFQSKFNWLQLQFLIEFKYNWKKRYANWRRKYWKFSDLFPSFMTTVFKKSVMKRHKSKKTPFHSIHSKFQIT